MGKSIRSLWVPGRAAVGAALVALIASGSLVSAQASMPLNPDSGAQASPHPAVVGSAEGEQAPEPTAEAEAVGSLIAAVERDDVSAELVRAAELYAAENEQSLDEAIRRLQLMGAMEDVLWRAESQNADRYAGGWIDNGPDFRLVLQLTHGPSIPALNKSATDLGVPVTMTYGHKTSWAQRLDELDARLEAMSDALPPFDGAYVDVVTKETVLVLPPERRPGPVRRRPQGRAGRDTQRGRVVVPCAGRPSLSSRHT